MTMQRTLRHEISAVGIGLHSGKRVSVSFRPAPADTGLVYTRVDLPEPVSIKISADVVRDTQLCTALVNEDGVRISTVEHLQAALSALGIDNLYIDVNAPEIPIMDGSAYPFVYLLNSAGVVDLNAPKVFYKVKKTVRVEGEGGKWAEFSPSKSGLTMDLRIEFHPPAIPDNCESVHLDFTGDNFVRQISRARTFCFMRDVEYMHAHHLALGGTLDNAVVMDDTHVINPEGLRYPDECTRHKLLDACGDIYMCNHTILGEFRAYKTGHALNNQLLRTLLSTEGAVEKVTFTAPAVRKQQPFSYVYGRGEFAPALI